MQENTKMSNIHAIRVLEEEKKECYLRKKYLKKYWLQTSYMWQKT